MGSSFKGGQFSLLNLTASRRYSDKFFVSSQVTCGEHIAKQFRKSPSGIRIALFNQTEKVTVMCPQSLALIQGYEERYRV